MRIFVAGAAGVLARDITHRLVATGHTVAAPTPSPDSNRTASSTNASHGTKLGHRRFLAQSIAWHMPDERSADAVAELEQTTLAYGATSRNTP